MQDTPFDEYLKNILVEVSEINSGEVASYIPELSKVDPNLFGISIVTVDGHVYQLGDTRHPFTIQSISKSFVYGLALEDNGVSKILKKVDVEPSGEAFNSISLEAKTGRPKNAMINAGAIATTGSVYGADASMKFDRILRHLITYTGHKLSIDNSVYRSESETGHRNKAISYLLRNSDIIEQEPVPIEKQDLCLGLDENEIELLKSYSVLKTYKKGDYIFKRGDSADTVYFLISGRVNVILNGSYASHQRIAILSPGTAFGELAMIDHGKRSATITADSDVTSMELKFYDLENEGSELSKNVVIKLTRNISKMLSDKLRRTNDVIKNLS